MGRISYKVLIDKQEIIGKAWIRIWPSINFIKQAIILDKNNLFLYNITENIYIVGKIIEK